jgi:hypothetical protein
MIESKTKNFAAPRVARLIRFTVAALTAWLAGASIVGTCRAEDITSLDGKTYQNIRDLKAIREGLVFSYGPESNPSRTMVQFRNLPTDLQKKYGYGPFEEGLSNARQNQRISLSLNSAFRLSNLEAAMKKAEAEKKLIGFIMCWDTMFRPAKPMDAGSPGGLAGFYTVFHDALVLVFVRHEDELDKVPDAVKQGFFGPEEGGWAPNMAVVTADCSRFVCEIPYGGEHSTGKIREPIFGAKIEAIKKFLEKPEASLPKPAEQTNAEPPAMAPAKATNDQDEIIPGQPLESIRKIPRQTRLLYGGTAMGLLILLVVLLRMFRNKAG